MIVIGARGLPVEVRSSPLGRVDVPTTIAASSGRIELLSRDVRAATYAQMYRRQPWVHVCVNKIARAVGRLPLHAFQLDLETGARDRERGTELAKLLDSPWPGGTPFAFKEFIGASCGVFGHALIVKARPDGAPSAAPTELWPVPWQAIEYKTDASGVPASYLFRGARGNVKLEPENVLHFRFGDGTSPLEALRPTLQLEDAAQRWAAHHFVNAATPSGVFSTELKLDKNTIPRLRAELAALYAGAENAGRFGIFDQGLKWEALSHSAVDTELIEQRKLSREEVAAVYDIPQPMVGILDRATYSNVTEQHKMLYQDTLGPWLTMIEETIMAQLVARDVPAFGGAFVEFELGEVLKGDLATRADAIAKLITSGVLTPNEARRLENRPDIDDPAANTIYMPLNLVPVGATADELEARARAAIAVGLPGTPALAPGAEPVPFVPSGTPSGNGTH